MAEVEMKQRGSSACGVAAGLLLLVFGGTLIATSQRGNEAVFSSLHGRKLQGTTTSLSVGAPAGATTLQLVSVAGFIVGQKIMIDANAADMHTGLPLGEENFVTTVGATGPNSIGLKTPMKAEHITGASVTVLTAGNFLASSGSLGGTVGAVAAGGGGVSWLLQCLLCFCYACIYKTKVVDPMGKMHHHDHIHGADFHFGLFGCAGNISMCLMVTCCPLLRMAHTNHTADVCGFWETFVCLWCSTLCVCGPLCLNVYFRIHIKDHMGLEDNCFNDLCLAFFCLPCITGQQALAVDAAQGFQFKCPCEVTHDGYAAPGHARGWY